MIVHESRDADFRRPFGAAEVSKEITLSALRPGAESMLLRLRTYDGHSRFLPMTETEGGRFTLTFPAPETRRAEQDYAAAKDQLKG